MRLIWQRQNRMDNLKSTQDYLVDFAGMATDIVSILAGNPSVGKLESNLSIAMDGVNTLIGNTDNWIKALSDLQTIVQDYSKYDDFLSLIESKAVGELKEAASILRRGMSKSMELYLNTYVNISNGENFDNFSEFIFSNFMFEAIKSSTEYINDDNVKFFVDGGQKAVDKYGVLNSSWNLGKKIGVLIGDTVVGGSNMIIRLQEAMALYDISKILQDELRKTTDEFLKSEISKDVTPLIQDYVMYSTFLASCRIRGEYCLYSIVANDAGLMSWFNKSSGENAKLWYDMQAKSIDDIQGQINSIIVNDNENTFNTNNESMFGEWEVDTNYTNDHNTKTTFDMFGTGYSYGSLLSLNEDKSFSYGVGIGYYGTGTYEIDNNTIKVQIDDYMEFEPDIGYDFTINIIEDNGSVLLELKGFEEDFNLYWKRTSNAGSSNVSDKYDYSKIIEKYSSLSPNSNYNELTQKGINPILSNQLPYINELYYTLYDVSMNDEIPELIIACGDEKTIIDIWSSEKRLFTDDYLLGEKNYCTIGDDGRIYYYEQHGAEEAYMHIYVLGGGGDLLEQELYKAFINENNVMQYCDIDEFAYADLTEKEYLNKTSSNYNNGASFEWSSIPIN